MPTDPAPIPDEVVEQAARSNYFDNMRVSHSPRVRVKDLAREIRRLRDLAYIHDEDGNRVEAYRDENRRLWRSLRELLEAQERLRDENAALRERLLSFLDWDDRDDGSAISPTYETYDCPEEERCGICGAWVTIRKGDDLIHETDCPYHPENVARARTLLAEPATSPPEPGEGS